MSKKLTPKVFVIGKPKPKVNVPLPVVPLDEDSSDPIRGELESRDEQVSPACISDLNTHDLLDDEYLSSFMSQLTKLDKTEEYLTPLDETAETLVSQDFQIVKPKKQINKYKAKQFSGCFGNKIVQHEELDEPDNEEFLETNPHAQNFTFDDTDDNDYGDNKSYSFNTHVKAVENTEDNFPSLGGKPMSKPVTPVSQWQTIKTNEKIMSVFDTGTIPKLCAPPIVAERRRQKFTGEKDHHKVRTSVKVVIRGNEDTYQKYDNGGFGHRSVDVTVDEWENSDEDEARLLEEEEFEFNADLAETAYYHKTKDSLY